MGHKLVRTAGGSPGNRVVRRAPPLPMKCVRRLEQVACDPPEPRARAAFTEGIILFTVAPLRFPGSRNIASTRPSKSAIVAALRYPKQLTEPPCPGRRLKWGRRERAAGLRLSFVSAKRLKVKADKFFRSYFFLFLTVGGIYSLLLQPYPQRGGEWWNWRAPWPFLPQKV